MSHYCQKCGKMLADTEFYKTRNLEKYSDGVLNTCKKCLTMHVDNWEPETFLWILEDIDVPYIKEQWDEVLKQWLEKNDPKKMTGMSILGKYLSKMKLKQWNKYSWKDTEMLEEENRQNKINQMKAQGLSGEEIDEQLNMDRGPAKPKIVQEAVGTPEYEDPEEQQDEFSEQLTEEDRRYLRIKWGRGYTAEEWVRLEQLYLDMEASYDIQGAGMKDTLIMICKASMKANQLIDAGEIEAFQKMTKVYNELMKSAKLTAAQNKAESNDCVDSIGELVAICEKGKFIPEYYVDSPKDKVDRVIQDMQDYTHDLVCDELGLGNMIENSLKALERERERIAAAAESGEDFEEKQEEELFKKGDLITDKDFIDFFEDEDEAVDDE